MKITYEFDTDKDSFERAEFETYKQSEQMRDALFDLSEKVRFWYKRDERTEIPKEEIYNVFFDILKDNFINLDAMM